MFFYISVECVIKLRNFFAVMKIILAVICLRRRGDCTSSGWCFVRVKHPSFATKGLMTFLLSWYYQKFHLGATKHIKGQRELAGVMTQVPFCRC